MSRMSEFNDARKLHRIVGMHMREHETTFELEDGSVWYLTDADMAEGMSDVVFLQPPEHLK